VENDKDETQGEAVGAIMQEKVDTKVGLPCQERVTEGILYLQHLTQPSAA
jgi:hypothetical protein